MCPRSPEFRCADRQAETHRVNWSFCLYFSIYIQRLTLSSLSSLSPFPFYASRSLYLRGDVNVSLCLCAEMRCRCVIRALLAWSSSCSLLENVLESHSGHQHSSIPSSLSLPTAGHVFLLSRLSSSCRVPGCDRRKLRQGVEALQLCSRIHDAFFGRGREGRGTGQRQSA